VPGPAPRVLGLPVVCARLGYGVFAFPGAGWQRVAVAACLVIPLVLVVLLMAPAWLSWPFLSDSRRKDVLALVGWFVNWISILAGSTSPAVPADDRSALH
jgi:hypothetical protein